MSFPVNSLLLLKPKKGNALESIASELILPGQPIYFIDSTHCGLAEAQSDFNKSVVVGIALNKANINEIVQYVSDSSLYLRDWTIVTETVNLTIPGNYYLSSEKGKLILEEEIPNINGFKVVRVGFATQEGLELEIMEPYEL